MSADEVRGVLSRIAAQLVEADAGELYVLPTQGSTIRLHLGGRFSGCPGNALVTDQVLRPLVQAAMPSAELEVSSGALVPAGAERLAPVDASADRAS